MFLKKLTLFYEILKDYLVTLANFQRKFCIYFAFFLIFEDLAFFETAYGQIWPLSLFWSWQPWKVALKRAIASLADKSPLLRSHRQIGFNNCSCQALSLLLSAHTLSLQWQTLSFYLSPSLSLSYPPLSLSFCGCFLSVWLWNFWTKW